MTCGDCTTALWSLLKGFLARLMQTLAQAFVNHAVIHKQDGTVLKSAQNVEQQSIVS